MLTVNAKEFTDALRCVRHAISNEQTRYYLCGTYVHLLGSKLVLVATDGHRLARVAVDYSDQGEPVAFAPAILSPEFTEKAIKDYGRARGGHHSLRFSIEGGKAHLAGITGPLVDGTFPDYQRVIPSETKFSVIVTRLPFLRSLTAIAAAGKVLGQMSMALAFKEQRVQLRYSHEGMTMTCEHELQASVPQDFTIGYNAAYLRDIFKSFDAGWVEFKFNDAMSPAIIAPVGDHSRFAVLMPMRL